MSDAITTDDVLAAVQKERRFWQDLVDHVRLDRFEIPGAMGEWTFKNVVAHLSGWDERRAAMLEGLAAGEPHRPVHWPWPAEIRPFPNEIDADDVDAANDWMYQANHNRPAEDVLADANTRWDRMEAAIPLVPESAWNDTALYEWQEGDPFGAWWIDGRLFEHLHEHDEETRAWLASLVG